MDGILFGVYNIRAPLEGFVRVPVWVPSGGVVTAVEGFLFGASGFMLRARAGFSKVAFRAL